MTQFTTMPDRVLVVEDHKDMRKLIRQCLLNLGFDKVDEAPDGAMAMTLMEINDYGLIISDLEMPFMNGAELLQEIRKDPATSGIPFIMLTGENKSGIVRKIRSTGADHYITKPFTPETLKRILTKVLNT